VADITRLLDRWSQGDESAFKELIPLVYDELRRLAEHYLRGERAGHTLQPTALVHEAYLRLSGLNEMRLQNRTHFYGAAAQAMRRILVDHARRRQADKRGSGVRPVSLDEASLDGPVDLRLDLVALEDALNALNAFAPQQARVVELRYFGGLSVAETAAFLGVAPVTVKRYWNFARAWLFRALSGPAAAGPDPGGR
jgi:RNA polymerase sigma factor (TIGR02999 family)